MKVNPIANGPVSPVSNLFAGANLGLARKTGRADAGRADQLVLSPMGQQKQGQSMLQNLLKQRDSLLEAKRSLSEHAKTSGESVKEQMEQLNTQLDELDSQISQVMTQQMEQAQEKKDKEQEDDQPKTEEEAAADRIQALTDLSIGIDDVQTLRSAKQSIDHKIATTKVEIELDQSYSKSAAADPSQVESPASVALTGKRALLAELENRSDALSRRAADQLLDLSEEVAETAQETQIVEEEGEEEAQEPGASTAEAQA